MAKPTLQPDPRLLSTVFCKTSCKGAHSTCRVTSPSRSAWAWGSSVSVGGLSWEREGGHHPYPPGLRRPSLSRALRPPQG